MSDNERDAMTRAEWIAAGAFSLNVLTLAFVAGVLWQTVDDHTRRIEVQENKLDALVPRVERIDANVAILVEEAREKRRRGER